MPFAIREIETDDFDAYVTARIDMTVLTYAHLMPPTFRAHLHGEHENFVAEYRANRANGTRRFWVAENHHRNIVGVVASGHGYEDWDRSIAGADWWPPATERFLDHLYTTPGTFGSGLGQRLLDIALAPDEAAYLWVVDGNDRAVRFWRRNGFAPDGFAITGADGWGPRPARRLVRPGK